MITVLAVKNPLDPWGSQQIIYLPDGTSIDDCIDAVYPPIPTIYDLAVSYNGNLIDIYNPPIVPDNCSVVFIAIPQGGGEGEGKNAAKIILGAIITVVGYLLTPVYGIGVPLVGMGIAMMGSGIAGLLLTPRHSDLLEAPILDNSVTSTSDTYGWSVQGNRVGEGLVLPELYGEMRVIPPLIGKYVQTIGNKQYLYMLFAVCRWNIDVKANNEQYINEGIEQVDSSLRGVYINDIESGYFGDIVIESSPGNNIQISPKGFIDTRTDVAHTREMLHDSYYEFDTAGSYLNGIILSFVFPYGLFKTETTLTGTNPVSTTVKLYFQHAPYVSEDHEYADNEYVSCTGVVLSELLDFRESYWSAGYFYGTASSDQPITWIQVDSDSLSVAHQEGEYYVHTGSFALPVGVPRAVCTWWKVTDGILEYENGQRATEYRVPYDIASTVSAEVTKNLTTSFSVDYLIANTPMENIGKRHIRCKRDESLLSEFNGRDKVFIQLSQEIVYKELTYPNVSLVAVQALATDKLSGSMPTISMVVSRSFIFVWGPASYAVDPTDETYWAYHAVRADNPAWICYDLLHGCRCIQNALTEAWEYVQTGPTAKENIRYENFKDWADFCDIHTKFHCFLKTAISANTTGWIALLETDKYPVIGDTFTTPVNTNTFTVTAIKSEQITEVVTLTTTSYTPKSSTSITGFTPNTHMRIQLGSTFTVSPATHETIFLFAFDAVLQANSLINATTIQVRYNDSIALRKGLVFTVGSYTDQYVVTSTVVLNVNSGIDFVGNVAFAPAAKQAWSADAWLHFGVAITAGSVTTYTVSEICSGSTIRFTPACDTIWPTGSALSVLSENINLTHFIKVATTGSIAWPEGMALSCIDHNTFADYPYKKKYTCNIYFDTLTDLRSALVTVGLCGRGSVIQEGSKYSCIVEKVEETPVQRFLFNMANIQDSSFEESWMALDERSNCFEIKYWDKYNNYKEDVVTVSSETINDLVEMKRTSIDLIGCTDEHMAAAFGKYLLNVNRYITLTASWTAYIDSIGCFPGQIIEVQNDVPQFGYGGRLLEGCTTTTLIFDRNLTLIPGSPTLNREYEIIFYHQSSDERVALSYIYTGATEIVTNTITGLTGIDVAPVADSKFIFGEINSSSKLMRIVSITRDSELKNKIVAMEFDNNVYSDGVDITPVLVSNLPQELRPPALGTVEIALTWKLNTVNKIYDPYVVVSGECGQMNRRNINPIIKYKLYGHIEDGDTRSITDENTINYSNFFEITESVFEYIATDLHDKTLFIAMTQINLLGYESLKTIADPFYINIRYDDKTILNLEIDETATDSYQGFIYAEKSYIINLNWTPIGWEISGSNYIPIERWNDGNNWYMYTNYLIVYGYVENPNDTPAIEDLKFVTTVDIGDIFDINGVKITNSTYLNNKARNASKIKLSVEYNLNYLKIAVVAIKKRNGISHIDVNAANYGLDWLPIRMIIPFTLASVLNTEISELELIISTQNNSVFLNEIRWDYPLTAPYIDGFAIIHRVQGFWWAWPVKKIIPIYKTGTTPLTFSDIVIDNHIDWVQTVGGTGAADNFTQQLIDWKASNLISTNSGMPKKYKYMYFSLTYQDQYEIMRVEIDDPTNTVRNTERLPAYRTETIAVTTPIGGSSMTINPTQYAYEAGFQFIVNGDAAHAYTVIEQSNQRTITFSPVAVHAFLPGETVIVSDPNNTNSLQEWPIGTIFSYLPNEWCDVFYAEFDTNKRHYIFDKPLEINCALHMTLIAVKAVSETQLDGTPGYERTPYSVWEAKLQP